MNALNYHHLFYFWTVCREGGFTRASNKLRISQSAVSEQIKKLEEVLGQKLIDRTTRSFELTENGNIALRYADMIFEAGHELVDFMLHRPKKGKQLIRIGALGSLSRNLQMEFLKPLLNRRDVTFNIIVGDLKRLSRLLKEHAIDVILSTHPANIIEAGHLYTHLLTQSPLCVVSSSIRGKIKLDQAFKDHQIYLPSKSLESRAEFDHYIESNGLKISPSGEIDDIALLRLLAINTKALIIIPRMGVITEIENSQLNVIHEFSNILQKYYAITRQKRFPNAIVEELVKTLANRLR